MKKTISQTMLFFMGGVLLVHGFAYITKHVAPDGNTEALLEEQQNVEELLANRETIEAIAIGNSHTWSINLKALGYEGYLFARPGGDLFEIRYHLEALIPRTTSVRTVLIPMSYHMFRFDNANAEETEARRTHIYNAVPSWKFIKGDFKNFIVGKSHFIVPIQTVLRRDNWKGIFDELTGNGKGKLSPVETAVDDCSYLEKEKLLGYTRGRVTRVTRLTREMMAKHSDLEEESFRVATEILLFLRAKQIRVIFFTPPYFHAYTDLYLTQDKETVVRMQQTMRRLQQEYGVEYYDFSRSKEFATNDKLFRDGDHLNGCGAILFSEKFKRVLKQYPRHTEYSHNSASDYTCGAGHDQHKDQHKDNTGPDYTGATKPNADLLVSPFTSHRYDPAHQQK